MLNDLATDVRLMECVERF